MEKCDIGVVGLATMGKNLALNMADRGFRVAVFNRTVERTKELATEQSTPSSVIPTYSPRDFVGSLSKPRRILLMVKAGSGVEEMAEQLTPHLSDGDVLMDGGNSHFKDTEVRCAKWSKHGVRFMGVGVSGGEKGARYGPCIMAGGPQDAYNLVSPILTTIAAQTNSGPCCAYFGEGGAGHLVKMVHNGIEYAILQVIAEVYDMGIEGLKLDVDSLRGHFEEWNRDRLGSYLLEITVVVLAKKDPETGKPLVELILDQAEQKGTGKWTSQTAMDLGVPTPTIDVAVAMRNLSSFKSERVEASRTLKGPANNLGLKEEFGAHTLRDALECSVIMSYAQGMAMLKAASKEYGYIPELSEAPRIWKGGCIIRAKLLDQIQDAYARNPSLKNLLVDGWFASRINSLQHNWRLVTQIARSWGIACPAVNSSLDYYDAYRRERLPANLIQALRDLFGSHTYRRVDEPGSFHTEW